MIHAPKMLLIGAAGRDAGKTAFACELVRRFCDAPVLAAKVTTVQERDGECPRGGAGCGVCSSLEADYCITEDVRSEGSKDTQRLVAAGAKRVFWLRVLKEHLEAGATALLDTLGASMPIICESNSLRQVVRPGLFILVQHRDATTIKDSARLVQRYADATVYSDGQAFDFDFDRIAWTGNKWLLHP